jgi:hypothetical protein
VVGDGRTDIVYTVTFYVVAPYDTGGVPNFSARHAASIFSVDELKEEDATKFKNSIKSEVINRNKKLDITAVN